jgi:hypothetical protein
MFAVLSPTRNEMSKKDTESGRKVETRSVSGLIDVEQWFPKYVPRIPTSSQGIHGYTSVMVTSNLL